MLPALYPKVNTETLRIYMLLFVVQTGNKSACFLFLCMCLPGLVGAGCCLDRNTQRVFAYSAFSHNAGLHNYCIFFVVYNLYLLKSGILF